MKPPVIQRNQELPFESLLWENFEWLCFRIAKLEPENLDVHMYGNPGQKQDGIDFYAVKKGNNRYTVYQCKRIKKISQNHIKNAIHEVLNGRWASKIDLLVFCSSEKLTSTSIIEEIENQRKILKERDIDLIIWDADHLVIKCKQHPQLIDDFFSKPWVEALCGRDVAQKLDLLSITSEITENSLERKVELARNILIKGNFNEAKEQFIKLKEEVLQNEPNNGKLMSRIENNIGVCLLEEGDKENALKYFESAVSFDQSDAKIFANIAMVKLDFGDKINANKFILKALGIEPTNEHARSIHINILAANGMFEEMKQYENDDVSIGVAFSLGFAYKERGELDKAEKWLRLCLKKAPEEIGALMLLSEILQEKAQKGFKGE